MRIVVRVSDCATDVPLELDAGEALLIGRAPEAARLAAPAPSGARPIREVVLDGAGVSSNHALLWLDGDSVQVLDLASKNGSWLKLPAGAPIALPPGGEPELQIGAAEPDDVDEEDEPDDAHWQNDRDYPEAVAGALTDWLARNQVPADVALTKTQEADGVDHVPLAGRAALRLIPRGTMDARWPAMVRRIWRYISRQDAIRRAEEQTRQEGLILASRSMRSAHRHVIEAARSRARLVLMGPSGSGKEGLARCYHRHAGGNGPFVARNCAMFSAELLRSELFGAEAGAFTGCVRRIIGAVERANGGTLFLDEIGELPREVQPMLLRFLDRGEYERMGSYGELRTADVNIVCATNKDLRAASARGEFRADLWYRLSIRIVDVPPLRDRFEDVEAYLRARRLRQIPVWDALAPAAIEALRTQSWQGNFRELANFVERLPGDAQPGSIDAAACRRALAEGSLTPIADASPAGVLEAAPNEWSRLAATALLAFTEDYAKAAPTSWDDVKVYIEKYMKPLVFAHLGQLASTSAADADIARLAAALRADRGTASKHLRRYFERFNK